MAVDALTLYVLEIFYHNFMYSRDECELSAPFISATNVVAHRDFALTD